MVHESDSQRKTSRESWNAKNSDLTLKGILRESHKLQQCLAGKNIISLT